MSARQWLKRIGIAGGLLCSPLLLAQPDGRSGLLEVYELALAHDARLGAAQAELQALRQAVPQARAGLLPQLAAGADYQDNRTRLDQPDLDLDRSGLVYQLNLSQPLFRADRWFSLQGAKALDQQANWSFAATAQALILQSAEAYLDVLRSEDRLAAFSAEEAALAHQFDQAEQRFRLGATDRIDVLQAQAVFDSAHANRLDAERRRQDAVEALATLTGHPDLQLQGLSHALPLLAPQPDDPQVWADRALQQNLQLRASEQGVQVAEQRLRQRKAEHGPSLDLVARYQKGDNDRFDFINPSANGLVYGGGVEQQSIGLQLNIPLYSGGLLRSQVSEAYHRADQQALLHEDLRRQLNRQVRELHRAINSSLEQIRARQQGIRSSRGSLEASEVGHQLGTHPLSDVLDAQRLLYASVRDYNEARYSYLQASLRLKLLAGTLAPSDLQALAPYLLPGYQPSRDFLPPP